MNNVTKIPEEEILAEEVVDSSLDESENLPEEIQIEERSRDLAQWFNRTLGLALLALSALIIALVIVTYFYHPGQPDPTSLLVEQIVGYVLFGLGMIFGIVSLLKARKLKESPFEIEQINNDEEIEVENKEEN